MKGLPIDGTCKNRLIQWIFVAVIVAGFALSNAIDQNTEPNHVNTLKNCGESRICDVAGGDLRKYIYNPYDSFHTTDIVEELRGWIFRESTKKTSGSRIAVVLGTLETLSIDEVLRLLPTDSRHAKLLAEGLNALKGSESNDSYLLSIHKVEMDRWIISSIGKTDIGALYSVYRFAKKALGWQYTLKGDWKSMNSAESLLEGINGLFKGGGMDDIWMELSQPKFSIRGILPFHDFPEGPDWWSADEYKSITTQAAKLNLNLLALHTYPYGNTTAQTGTNEPTVWIGTKAMMNTDGTVKKSYPSSYANSMRGQWGYSALPTSKYSCGAQNLFNDDCCCSPVQPPEAKNCPVPTSSGAENDLFDATSNLLAEGFGHANIFAGVKTAVGTEVPVSRPDMQYSEEEYYKGMFEHVQRAYTIDYYMLWTNEDWEWRAYNHTSEHCKDALESYKTALKVKSEMNVSFELTTCGWLLGPVDDHMYFDSNLPESYVMTSLEEVMGTRPVDPAFETVSKHRETWTIPWLEDDPGLTAPQLWVNRTLEHMSDAYRYGISGVMGITWRILETEPQTLAFSEDAWTRNSFDTHHSAEEDFWESWAQSKFGAQLSDEIANIFRSVDSDKMPRPVEWINGPGSLKADTAQCTWSNTYAFVDKLWPILGKLKDAVAQDHLKFWIYSFEYMRSIAKTNCNWGNYNAEYIKVIAEKDPTTRKKMAEELLLPLRVTMITSATNMIQALLPTSIRSSGALGTVQNLFSHSFTEAIVNTGEKLAELLQTDLPTNATLQPEYFGPPVGPDDFSPSSDYIDVAVPTARTLVVSGETLPLIAFVLRAQPKNTPIVTLYMRAVGGKQYSHIVLKPVAKYRDVFETVIPHASLPVDTEIYVEAVLNSSVAFWPPGAPSNTHVITVI